MTLSDLSIQRPVLTTMTCVLLLVLGVVGMSRLGTDLFPDMAVPVVSIVTVYRGAGPSEVESQVTRPIEDAVAGISGIDAVRSFSRESASVVFVQFKLNVPLDRVLQDVRDKVGSMPPLPKEVDAPRISRIDVGAQPILTYAVKSELRTPQLRELLRNRVVPAVGQIDGVAQVRVIGGDERQIRVAVRADRAKAAGIALWQVAERIGAENVNIPLGRYDLGSRELGIRSIGQFATIDDLRNLPLTRNTDFATQVRLDEVAEVSDGVADRRTIARLDGAEAVVLEVVKQPGADTVEVSRAVKARIDALTPSLGHAFAAKTIIDSSDLIESMIHEVWTALIFGGLMAVAIIYLFLLDPRGTAISALALPTSIIGTFFVMYTFGYTLNLSTLLALSLAIGLLIDDAVVVREAITRRLEAGERRALAASRGTRDVFLAVLATTLSLVSVFVPVAFMPGVVGQFFKQFGVSMTAAVLISMFISFTLDPMLSARFSRELGSGEAHRNALERVMHRFLDWLDKSYFRSLTWTLAHPKATALIVVAILAAAGGVASTLGTDFMAPMDKNMLIVKLELPEGSSLEETSQRTAQAETILRSFPDVVGVYSLIGVDPATQAGGSNQANLRVLLKKRKLRAVRIEDFKEQLRGRLAEVPATAVALIDPPVLEGVGDFLPLMVYVTGPDLAILREQAARLGAVLSTMRDKRGRAQVTDIRVQANPPKPELTVTVDRTTANTAGITSLGLGGQLRLALDGQLVGKLREGASETDIMVRLADADRESPETLEGMDVFTPRGVRTVGDLARLSFESAPSVIERYNRERSIAIFALNAPTAPLGEVGGKFKQALIDHPLPPGYATHYFGQIKVLGEQNAAFAFVFGLAFVFVYVVLASQFESFKHPITIMVSMPLALVGAMVALFLSGWSLSLGSGIGLILLLGLVTKNAILLVDQALQNLRSGDELIEALVKAGPRRLRPILMTSAAMGIGMVPTALSRGPGFEFMSPMAIGVIGGVISSTLLTLFVVPLLFLFLENVTPKRFRDWIATVRVPKESK